MHNLAFLNEILILLFATVFIVVLFRRLGLSPVLGYLVSGALIGSNGFGIIEHNHTTESIAEIGIVFLLFSIGLELTLERLISMKRFLFGFGAMQVLLTSVVIIPLCMLFKFSFEQSLLIGFGLALSSTPIVIQVLKDTESMSTRVGRISFATLLFQDLVAIPLLILVPIMASDSGSFTMSILSAFGKTILVVGIIFVVGRVLLRPIFALIDSMDSSVLFVATILIIIFSAALISERLGISLALGAFFAGVMVAETEYSHKAAEGIESYKGLLMGLFFVTIGMSFSVNLLVNYVWLIIFLALTLVVVKSLIVTGICRFFGMPLGTAIHCGLVMSQAGEFGFILFSSAVHEKILSSDVYQILMTAMTISMALTPMLGVIGKKVKEKIHFKHIVSNKIIDDLRHIKDHIVIIGFGRTGQTIASVFRRIGVDHIIIDKDHAVVQKFKDKGHNNIFHCNAVNLDILRYFKINNAEAVIVATNSDRTALEIIKVIDRNFNTTIIAKSDDIRTAKELKRAGGDIVIVEKFEASLQISTIGLKILGIEKDVIENTVSSYRNLSYNDRDR